MKLKLWIGWGVMSATAIGLGLGGEPFAVVETVAIIAAAFGWAAFLVRS